METNKTLVCTSKNYGINSFFVEDKMFDKKIENFECFTTNFDGQIKQNKNLPLSPICESSNEQLKKANISVELDMEKNFENPVILNFNFEKNNCLVDKIKINIKEGINAKILINYQSLKKCFHNGFISVNCEKNAKANIIIIYDLSQNSDNFICFENSVKENGFLDITTIDFSGNYSVQRYICDIFGNDAISKLNTMYISDENSKIDLNFAQNLHGKNSNANIKTIGALQGKSYKNFKGLIDFKRGSIKSKGDEEEYCLLLSKEARSKALPLLCASEEDVEGSHSSATGKIGDDELFYIMSRGIDKTEGLKLLLKAQFAQILNNIFDSNLKEKINEKIDRKIINGNN